MKNLTSLSLSTYLGRLRYGDTLRPGRDWFVVIGIAVIVLIASIALNVWFFISLANSENAAPAVTTAHTTSSAGAVTDVQNIFQERATQQTDYQQTYHFVDPSVSGS
jgi:hypothetical protein